MLNHPTLEPSKEVATFGRFFYEREKKENDRQTDRFKMRKKDEIVLR